ncbi:hypothetical protein N2152v2_009679 [Parachlorella kessleri]
MPNPSSGPAIGLPTHTRKGIPASFYDTVSHKSLLGEHGVEKELVNKQGLKLATYYWPAEHAKAVLIFVHGHGAHLLFEMLRGQGPGQPPVYEGSWVEAFNTAGISVCGIDNQGCGRSEGLHGLRFYVERFDDYVDDVLQLARSLRDGAAPPGFTGLPVFLGGLSMGGCIVFNAMLREAHLSLTGELFRGALMLAPMLSLERVSRKGINPYIMPLSNLLSKIWPTGEVVATDRNTLYPDIQEEWDKDPLTMKGKTRVRNANEYLRITQEVMKTGLDRAAFPFLVFHSENDTMCDCDGSKQLYQRAKSADKQLRLVNHMWHVLMRERDNEKIHAEMVDFILARA